MADDLDIERALTVTQPWGGLLVTGIKPIENRKRKMAPRGLFGKRFAIHASREIDEDVYGTIAELAPDLNIDDEDLDDGDDPFADRTRAIEAKHGAYLDRTAPWYKLSRVTSAIIGFVTLEHGELIGQGRERNRLLGADWARVGDASRWFFGPIGYVLTDPIVLPTPVPARGFQGFWKLTPDQRRDVRVQLSIARSA